MKMLPGQLLRHPQLVCRVRKPACDRDDDDDHSLRSSNGDTLYPPETLPDVIQTTNSKSYSYLIPPETKSMKSDENQ